MLKFNLTTTIRRDIIETVEKYESKFYRAKNMTVYVDDTYIEFVKDNNKVQVNNESGFDTREFEQAYLYALYLFFKYEEVI